MPDIIHALPVRAPMAEVFRAVASPGGLDRWWTLGSEGQPVAGSEYALDFGPDYQWRARVAEAEPPRRFVLEMTASDGDWAGTRVVFDLREAGEDTRLEFRHEGWREANDHYATTSYCWAMYLRILRRALELGEAVPYARRLDVDV